MVREPERQCIGCGRRGPQSGFVRLTLEPGSDPKRVVVADKGDIGAEGRIFVGAEPV